MKSEEKIKERIKDCEALKNMHLKNNDWNAVRYFEGAKSSLLWMLESDSK